MTFTPCREEFLPTPFFVVAVALKPYYNLANLEKAGSRVKQKEFIRSIAKARRKPPAAHQRSGPPCGHFFLSFARLGSSRLGCSSAHAEPLPSLQPGRREIAATRHFPSSRARPQSRRNRARPQAPGRSLFSRRSHAPSRAAFPPLAHASRPFSRESRESHRRLHWFS
jgi:hypothetical protein